MTATSTLVRPALRGPATAGRATWWAGVPYTLPALGVSLAVVLPGLGHRALWKDEYATWYAATIAPGELIRLLQHIDALLGPYYVFMHVWIDLFGDSATSLRLPSAVAMAVAAGLTSLLGWRLLGGWAGAAAGVVFAALPIVSRYGQEARPYAMAVAASLVATLMLLRALERPTWWRWWAYGAVVVTTGLLHVVAVLVLLPHAVVVLRASRRTHDLRVWRWAAAVGVVVTVLLPFAAKGSQETDAISWIQAGPLILRQFPGKLFGAGGVAGAVSALGVIGALVYRRRRPDAVWLLATWAVVPVVFCYLTFPMLHLFLYRYLLFTLPAWCLLAVAGPAAARWSVRRQGPVLAMVLAMAVAAGVGLIGVTGQADARRSPVPGEPDFRAAARLVLARMDPGDGIAFSSAVSNGRIALAYELRHGPAPRDVFLDVPSRQSGTFGALECKVATRCAAGTTRIWLVGTDAQLAGQLRQMPKAISQLLRDHFVVSGTWVMSDVSVRLLTKAS
jgi:mannosyltransferase